MTLPSSPLAVFSPLLICYVTVFPLYSLSLSLLLVFSVLANVISAQLYQSIVGPEDWLVVGYNQLFLP